jgi:hypothetical protein
VPGIFPHPLQFIHYFLSLLEWEFDLTRESSSHKVHGSAISWTKAPITFSVKLQDHTPASYSHFAAVVKYNG